MDESFKELQLLPTPRHTGSSSSQIPPWPLDQAPLRSRASSTIDPCEGPTLDLQLSISLRSIKAKQPIIRNPSQPSGVCMETVRWQASEQIRLAAQEKTYIEHMREMTRREMEIAQSEFARARHIWERAREDIERAERLKEQSITRVGNTGLEITCHSCRQKFRP